MKILSTVSSVLFNAATSTRIWNINRLLHSLGYEVHLVQYTKESTWKKWGGNKFDPNCSPQSVVFASACTVHLKHLRELGKDSYAMVYGNAHNGTFLSLMGKLRGVPLVFDMHGGLVEELLMANSNPASKFSFSFFLSTFIDIMDVRFSDKIICVSKAMVRYLHEQKRVPQEKLAYVTNGVDLKSFRPVGDEKAGEIRKNLGIDDKLVFGYVGGFQRWQGVENFIEAARRTDDRKIAFLIVGGNGRKMEKEDNMIFVPRVPRTQVPLYYSISDVLVLPRPSHPATEIAAPTKFAEYVAMNKPVLVTNVGDAANLVRRHNCGIVIKNNAAESLVEGMERFRNKSEREIEEMGRNSRKLAENEFDWNKIKDNLHEAIRSV
jgi:glycosyltransferase involved in cell wall biosynthesis